MSGGITEPPEKPKRVAQFTEAVAFETADELRHFMDDLEIPGHAKVVSTDYYVDEPVAASDGPKTVGYVIFTWPAS